MADDKQTADAEGGKHPWRENIEAITMAVVMAVMLKYFVVEAYKIPTGSMQPTLMGNDETGIKDRILVDKLSYHYRDPERWEVTVFKYPLDLSKNFIKRLVGVGPEELRVRNGDLWNRPDAESEWTVLRRPLPVQQETWKPLHVGADDLPGWKPLGGARAWRVEEDEVEARGDGSLRFPPSGSVMDDYRHGYPLAVRRAIRSNRLSGQKPVGDLRVAGEVEAQDGLERVMIELREGTRSYAFLLPGPAASAEDRVTIAVDDTAPVSPIEGQLRARLEDDRRLRAGEGVRFAAQNLDDQLQLELDGEVVLTLEIPPASDQRSSITIHVEGSGADLSDLEVHRDIYYLGDSMKRAEWQIPAGHYVMLGDNTQDSSDSREWTLERYRHPKDGGEVLRGNHRANNENPRIVQGLPGGPEMWFRDEWGELHHFKAAEAERLTPEAVSFVPRELITGRAVLVFWPLKPSFGLWRLAWVH
jgi:signal peptidase I